MPTMQMHLAPLLLTLSLRCASSGSTSMISAVPPCTTPPCLFSALGTQRGKRLQTWCGQEAQRVNNNLGKMPVTLGDHLTAKAAARGPGLILDVGAFDGVA